MTGHDGGELEDYRWFQAPGALHSVAAGEGLRTKIVTIGAPLIPTGHGDEVSELYQSVDVPGKIEGFSDTSRCTMMEREGTPATPYR